MRCDFESGRRLAEGSVAGGVGHGRNSDTRTPHKVDIDLGRDVRVCSVEIDWETAYAEDYTIAADGVRVFDGAAPGARRERMSGKSPGVKGRPLHVIHDITLDVCRLARALTIDIHRGATPWGVSIWHVGVMGTVSD